MFEGYDYLDQILKIFQVLGTPNQGLFHDLDDGTIELPSYQPMSLSEVIGTEDNLLIDLISNLLTLDPNSRITAREAINHPYFDPIRDVFGKRYAYLPSNF